MVLESGKIINLMEVKIIPITGDASFRRFYRIVSKKKSTILVYAEKEKFKNLVAYSTINEFLRSKNILAPKLYNHDFKKGTMIIQDFGNLSFYKILLKTKKKFPIYKNLVNFLLTIQKIKVKKKIKNVNKGFYILDKYSKKKLLEESNLFFDWYLPLFYSKKKSKDIKIKTNTILLKLYNKLNLDNRCFVQRDYHSQNLMKVGKKIGIIDNQDALLGNYAYDLVSLIDDVRIKTSEKLKKKIYNYYLKKNKEKLPNFYQDFNILSVQRSLKILGIFSRLFTRDKKNQYLKFFPYTWRLLEMRMKSKIFFELEKILNINIPKSYRKKTKFK